ncbi:MAG: hypothetical protein ACERJ2_14200 [Filomicrobium sp.]
MLVIDCGRTGFDIGKDIVEFRVDGKRVGQIYRTRSVLCGTYKCIKFTEAADFVAGDAVANAGEPPMPTLRRGNPFLLLDINL